MDFSKSISILMVINLVCVFIMFISAPSAEERANAQSLKYKNGPIVLETNSVGCTKYDYYDTKYWSCPDKSIKEVEEEVCTSNPGRAASCHKEMVEVKQ